MTVALGPSRVMMPEPPPGAVKLCTRSVPPLVTTGPCGVSTTCPSARRGGAGGAGYAVGTALIRGTPWVMKALSVAGTAAMFLVGGGILTHGIGVLHHGIEGLAHGVEALPVIGHLLGALTTMLLNGVAGLVAGALTLAVVTGISRLRGKKAQ